MATVRRTLAQALVALSFLVAPALPAFAKAERVALVVGNGAYEREADRLDNPANDARRIADTLESLGFEVIRGQNLDQKGFYDSLRRFEQAAREAEVALFFYAGHGVQFHGDNYLVPTNVTVRTRSDIDISIPFPKVMETLQSSTNIVFLDACRDNAMLQDLADSEGKKRTSSWKYRGATRVRDEMVRDNDTLIIFATKSGQPALDGQGENSPFTLALLAHIVRPGISLYHLYPDIAAEVRKLTNERQTPSFQGELTGKPFFFRSEESVETPVQTVRVATPPDTKDEPELPSEPGLEEEELWDRVKDSKDPSRLQAYPELFPSGRYVKQARSRLTMAIMEATDPQVLRAFRDDFPDSEFRNLAGMRLEQLEKISVATASPESADSSDQDPVAVATSPELPEPVSEPITLGPDDAAFMHALGAGTMDSYMAYLREYSDGRHAKEAQKRLSALRKAKTGLLMWEDRLWSTAARSGDRTDCEIYLEAYEGGTYRRSAERCLAALS